MSLLLEALRVLEATSRTFFIPINRLPPDLLEAVAASYLCMRAIDEIEDHPDLTNVEKVMLLKAVGLKLQPLSGAGVEGIGAGRDGARNGTRNGARDGTGSLFPGYESALPEVTLRIHDWAVLAPRTIAPRVLDAITAMAERMAYWAGNGWQIHGQEDLDRYTFGVAGAVGLLLSDLWAWYDGTQTNREHAVGFGRGLQSVNVLRNRAEDLSRGVDFFPDGWGEAQLHAYSRYNLSLAEAYLRDLPPGPALNFCRIPYDLACATLDALARGERKLSRQEVMRITAPAGEASA